MVEDALVPFGSNVVRLVDENVVEFVGSEPLEHVWLAQSLSHGEQVAAIGALASTGQQSQFVVCAT